MANTWTFSKLVALGLALPAPALAAAPASAVAAASIARVDTSPSSEADQVAADDGPPLLLDRSVAVGGYGGLDVAYSRMFGQDGAIVGVQGALLLDHRLSLGIAGYGWSNSQPGPDDSAGNSRNFEAGYGGATIRYSFYMQDFPVYLTVGALVGGGAIALAKSDDSDFDDLDSNESEDIFAVLQPELTLNANLTRWMRVGVTGGYRMTRGVDRNGFDESDINGLILGGQVQFGSF